MDIITLSSSDDETKSVSPPRKRIKLQRVPTKTICLDSSDDEEQPALPLAEKENGNRVTKSESPIVTDENTNLVIKTTEVENIKGECSPPPIIVESEPKIDDSNKDIIEEKLRNFFDKCLQTIKLPQQRELFSTVFPKVKTYYDKLKKLNYNVKEFECILDRDKNIEYDGPIACSRFEQIFRFLKNKIVESENNISLPGPKKQQLQKLEETLALINRRIAKLEKAEIDFDDEENSHYMQAAKYKERAVKIFKKICEIRKEDSNIDRPLYTKVNFTKSKYPEFNKAINKKFKDFLQFPTYYDMDRCIRQCATDKGLDIHEEELKSEVKFCFEKLGLSMKQKRSLELYDIHSEFISGTEDPALNDEEVSNKLRENYSNGQKRMDEILEKYTRIQETGVDPNVSSDSDDSCIDSD
ncbi:hypothetical protein RI129_010693 [Pyrocoelia pectoralis]|uniref:Daxx histone-binding domain-containing protein n=1 Tax=Pyrocoelia pectoralis TaxID=417401 RepID=A0AAN7V2F4_9COLE